MGMPIVISCDGLIFLLTGSIPDLELQAKSINFSDFPHMTNSDGHHVVLEKLALGVANQQTTLANSRVSNYDYFASIVILFLGFLGTCYPWLHSINQK